MRAPSILLALPLVAILFAGCLTDTPQPEAVMTPTPVPFSFDYYSAAWPAGESTRNLIADYIMTHPHRMSDSTWDNFMAPARADLVKILEGNGLTVVEQNYGSGVNILGIKKGIVDPDQWVVLSAHYDTAATTVFGAWDDGAGTATLLELSRTAGTWQFPFTLVFAFFDEEEKGLVGSQNFVKTYASQVDLVANLNTDPPGLNWPCGDPLGSFPVKIIHEKDKVDQGQVRYVWLFESMEHGLEKAGVPDSVRDYTPGIPIATAGGAGLSGTSDHANFGRADVANVFLGGTPTTTVGPVSALTYALHTPLDTLQQMEARCTGGAGTLADGLHTIGTVIGHTLVQMATSGVPAE